MTPLLDLQNIHATAEETTILQGLSLTINPGEVHVVMGPNGSGKSTLTQVIAGNEHFHITKGSATYSNSNLLELSVTERATKGIFTSFQHPVELPGVSTIQFLKTALNEQQKAKGLEPIPTTEFIQKLNAAKERLHIEDDMLKRGTNEGFSGGEKKKNEILQMLVLKPTLIVLDEIDSGLDVDALKLIGSATQESLNKNNALLLITHYQRILKYITPTHVHIMSNGKIVQSGGIELAQKIEQDGYANE